MRMRVIFRKTQKIEIMEVLKFSGYLAFMI